ncbi:Gram-negative porin [Candidatus Hepatincola sp. Pdp]
MKLNKYIWPLLAASMFSYGAQAAEVYTNDNGDSLSIGGYIDIRAGNKSSGTDVDYGKIGIEDNSSRLTIDGKKTVNQDIKVVSQFEWGFNSQEEESDHGDMFNNRLAYAGMESDKYGTALVGKQWSVFYDVAGWTDMYASTGGEALGVYEFDSGGFSGRGRADQAATYRKTFGGLTVGLQAQGYDDAGWGGVGDQPTPDDEALTRNYGVGGSLVYKLTNTLQIGASYYYTDVEKNSELATPVDSNDLNQHAAVIGIKYDGGIFGIAVDASELKNAFRYGENSFAIESYLTAKYSSNGSYIYAGNNTLIGDTDDGHNNDINYLAIGFVQNIMDDGSFYVYGEYRYDLRSDEDMATAANNTSLDADYVGADMSEYRLGVRYIF